jgi:hypothetical protein
MRTTSTLVAQDAARMAARPNTPVGGVRRRDETRGDFRARTDNGMTSPAMPGVTPPNRRDNILAARTDGTFDAKVAAYNQAGAATGHSMDAAGNITAPPPAAVKPGGRLIPGHSPGSSIWQPDTPTSQPGQPGQSSPSVLPPTLKRPAAPRPGGTIDGQPAAQTLAALKTAQAQVPRQTARNPASSPAVQLPTVASAMTPPVTPPSPSQGPAAKALADFNAKNPNVFTGEEGVAYTDTLASMRRGKITDAQNTLKTQREAPHRQLQKDMMQPYAPVKQLNTGIASIDAVGPGARITSPAQDLAEAIRPGVNAQRAQQGILPPTPAPAPVPPAPPQPIANNSQPPQTPPSPGYFAQKAAANPGGIISKATEAAGMFKNSVKTGVQNITNAAQVVAPIAAAPLIRAQQDGQTAVKTITSGMQKQAVRNPQGFFGKLTAPSPPKAKTKVTPPPQFAGAPLLR